jgi:protein-disulfide isomerase
MKIKKKDLSNLFLIVLAVAAIGLTVVNVYLLTSHRSGGSGTGTGRSADNSLLGSTPALGSDNAYVTIVEFSDYQCPYCKQFHTDIFPDLKANYIDTGKVRFIYRDFPLPQIHPYAMKASEAAHCANDQGKFWEYHQLLFDNSPNLDVDSLKQYAAQAGLDVTEFSQCLDSDKDYSEVKKDMDDGIANGVGGTPYFLVNDKVVGGLPSKSQFFSLIDQEVSKAMNG